MYEVTFDLVTFDPPVFTRVLDDISSPMYSYNQIAEEEKVIEQDPEVINILPQNPTTPMAYEEEKKERPAPEVSTVSENPLATDVTGVFDSETGMQVEEKKDLEAKSN